MTQRNHDVAAPNHRPAPTSTSPTRTNSQPAVTDDSTAFSLAALAEAELRRTSTARRHDPASSGVVILEGLRGHRTSPTHRLVDPALPAPAPAGDRPWARTGTLAVAMAASAMIGALAVATPSVTPTPTLAFEHKARPAATLALHHAAPTLSAAEAVLRSDHRAKLALEVASAEQEDAPEADEVAQPEAPARATTPARARTAQAAPARPRSSPTPAATPARPAAPAITANCVLDPASCGPERLTSAQVRTGLQQVVPAAKTCAAAHGAATDTRVQVRLSIAGATGNVRSATPQAPHQNALGRCVANELSRASFPTFTQSSMGVLYTVTL